MKAGALIKERNLTHAEPLQRRGTDRAGFDDLRPSAAVQRKLMQVAQRAGLEEEEPAQRAAMEEEEKPLQAKAMAEDTSKGEGGIGAGPQNGLPAQLKAGIEAMSGMSMDQVKVHYNSDKPAQLQAHAYAQGSDIHLGPGQEHHLPHEAWHVVQQAQGRVRPTMQMKGGVPLNDNAGLEAEADTMGAKALAGGTSLIAPVQQRSFTSLMASPIQRATTVHYEKQNVNFTPLGTAVPKSAVVGKKMTATLDPNAPIKGSTPKTGGDTNTLYEDLNKKYGGNYVRGHLLNDNLGGLGVMENLYPLSTAANGAHLEHVEGPVKALLISGNTVKYEVTAKQNSAGADFLKSPKSTLGFSASVGTQLLISRVIPVDPVVGNWGLNEELAHKGFGSQGGGIAPSRNKKEWITYGVKAGYFDKTTNALIGTSDQDTYY